MLDIKFIRENRDIVEKAIRDKKTEPIDLDKVIQLYEERKALRTKLDEVNAARNKAAKEQNHADGKRLKEEAGEFEIKLPNLEKELVTLVSKIPNVPSADTPVGDESVNKIIRTWGEPKKFPFEPKAHWDLGKDLDIIDSEKAAEVSGARFAYLKGDLALMQFALIGLAFKTLGDVETLSSIAADAGTSVTITPFVPVVPPVLMRTAVMNRMARLHPMDERYVFEKDDLVLVGSAEHTIGPLHMDEILEEKRLPIRYVGYSTAFRREAGAAGKDTRGILRQHQFEKIELETFVVPEKSMEEQNFIVAIQEHLMQSLKLPYQVVLKSTGDQGAPNHRGIDIETWMPGQNTYRETHTSDLMTSYQSRRLNTRVRRTDGKVENVHMNDATVFAIGRTLIAVMENNQQKDGSIVIPTCLQGYMGKDVIK
ncbi:serine--tRNA ligase [Candidatus Kaiserbacteria bacterium RIFCSPHIGHO2_01_FULL_50_13]|uniref:Serine--tRNA ligase n=1 Tax=Candidatus Kaiserbacteria bacterium RIFCSPLOWO2_01_FULL_50_24 TaxID=1798507 RepID=A0A1F6ER53_9BACT|nr:MAG: serine--tRNA ligase [Candidatus Kaiserbacteria bacterium RIFCSPHIGHO2_01_FULL_50_13]OGG76104.1 MAG: serine--tRNA ligase [Candidatus Kaiserbacteria bacterium RIFCSPLOWO2_01_FULL_50_24]OGG82365.1 MAG: serine--tRNA ligase [Candidatus Kaiserbacteria bacterium RIFCSPLOWO2_02_FULL_51_13]HXK38953.1 serine--tRNA ligase [Candidatus Paceibacterota bacterium]